MTTKPVVVGTHGSPEALDAVEWAAREAALRGAPLRIVSVAEMLPRMRVPAQAAVVDTVAGHLVRDRDEALAAAASAAAAVSPGLPVETAPLDGPAAEAVTHSGSDAQLLVVGSHDGGSLAAMTLGSVSRYAVAHATCPVAVVRKSPADAHRLVVVGVRIPRTAGRRLPSRSRRPGCAMLPSAPSTPGSPTIRPAHRKRLTSRTCCTTHAATTPTWTRARRSCTVTLAAY